MTAVYRVYTEDKPNLRELATLSGIVGCSVYHVDGIYAGQLEAGAVVEVVGTADDGLRIADYAARIVATNGQQSVIVLRQLASGALDAYTLDGVCN